jgi:uncharacterized protein YndB with AHSA1/START domain
MANLDFKFVIHHGEMVKQRMGGREELAGRDVILIHRLLKNSVNERFGNRAYALYSDSCIRAMGIDPAGQGLVEHHETIDIIGDVVLWVRDLEEAWLKENERSRTEVTRADSYATLEFDLAAARPTVWEHFTVPGHRPRWQGSDGVVEMAENGRRGVGTKNHCMHGKDVILEEVLDWRPFDYITLSNLLPIPNAPKVVTTYALEDRPNGATHIEIRIGKPKPKDRPFVDQVAPGYAKSVTAAMAELQRILEGRQSSVAVIDEPPMMPSRERFLTEPVRRGR